MKVIVLYRPNSEFSRSVESFVGDLQAEEGISERQLEVLNYDSREGSATASLYDVMTQPAILIVGDDGGYVKHWQGNQLPMLDEVVGYIYNYQ